MMEIEQDESLPVETAAANGIDDVQDEEDEHSGLILNPETNGHHPLPFADFADATHPAADSYESFLAAAANNDDDYGEYTGRLEHPTEPANPDAVHKAVVEVTKVFSKPAMEKERFMHAVEAVVTGRLTIKESSTEYKFATSTLHPYVHKARHILGDAAPPLKNPPRNAKQLTPKCVLQDQERQKKREAKAKGEIYISPLETADSSGQEDNSFDWSGAVGDNTEGVSGLDLWNNMNDKDQQAAAENLAKNAALLLSKFGQDSMNEWIAGGGASGTDDNEGTPDPTTAANEQVLAGLKQAAELMAAAAAGTQMPVGDDEAVDEKPKYDSVEDAARDAIDAACASDDTLNNMQMFIAVVKVLNRDVDVTQAARMYSIDAKLIEKIVRDAQAMLGIKIDPEQDRINSLPSMSTIDESVRRITSTSHYTGNNKDRLYQAVYNTVKGELPLTQAAAVYSIPFSTLHPYVKKVRQDLRLIEPDSDQKPSQSSSAAGGQSNGPTPRPTMSTVRNTIVKAPPYTSAIFSSHPSKPIVNNTLAGIKRPGVFNQAQAAAKKVKRQPFNGPGAAHIPPFRPVRIPDSWKQNPKLMRQAVVQAVQTCHYGDLTKRDRLCQAVYEAVSGQKTMKMAAVDNKVPFTTLQTYFHRTRVALAKTLGDDPCLKDQKMIKSPVSKQQPTPPPSQRPNVSVASSQPAGMTTDVLQQKKSALDALLSQFRDDGDRMDDSFGGVDKFLGGDSFGSDWDDRQSNTSSTDRSSSQQPTTGSNRRKPKNVVRNESSLTSIVASLTAKHGDTPPPPPTSSDTQQQQQHDSSDDAPLSTLVTGAGGSEWDADTWMEDEPLPIGDGDDDIYNTPKTSQSNTSSDTVGSNAYGSGSAGASYHYNYGVTLEGADAPKLEDLPPLPEGHTVESIVAHATQKTHYTGSAKQRMIDALVAAVGEIMPLKDAAVANSVPLNALHTYYHRARAIVIALRSGQDPKAVLSMTASQASAEARRAKDMASGIFTDIESSNMSATELCLEAVRRVTQSSLYPPEQKQRLKDAVEKVIFGEMTINAAATKYHLPSSTVHPYVHRARALLGDRCPPQATPLPNAAQHGNSARSASGTGARSLFSNEVEGADGKISAKLTLKSIKQQLQGGGAQAAGSSSTVTSISEVDPEMADQIVSELVKCSLYDMEKRQRLHKAILAVVLERASTSEAARQNQVPPSTIQPYVQKTRVALGLPINGFNGAMVKKTYTPPSMSSSSSMSMVTTQSSVPPPSTMSLSTKRAPITTPVYAAPGEEASMEECEHAVQQVVQPCAFTGDKRMRLIQAILEAVTGESTIKEACTLYELNGSTVHPYVSRARQLLGNKCPTPKSIFGASAAARHQAAIKLEKDIEKKFEKPSFSSTVDSAETSTPEYTCVLEKELHSILCRYNYRGDLRSLVSGIRMVLGDNRTLLDVSTETNVAQTTLSTYVRIAKLFLKETFITDYQSQNNIQTETTAMPASVESTDRVSSPNGTEVVNPQAAVEAVVVSRPASDQDLVKKEAVEEKTPVQPTKTAVLAPTVDLPSYDEYIQSFTDQSGDAADIDERRMKASIRYLIKMQYRRSPSAQQLLIDACEDVLLNGLSPSESLSSHSGVSEHVLNIYLQRVRDACELFNQPLVALQQHAAKCKLDDQHVSTSTEPDEQGDLEDTDKTTTTPTTTTGADQDQQQKGQKSKKHHGHNHRSPVRISRRLKEKEEEKKRQEQLESVHMPASLVQKMQDFVGQLESANVPVPERFIIGIGRELMLQNDDLSVYSELSDELWHEWYESKLMGTATAANTSAPKKHAHDKSVTSVTTTTTTTKVK